MKHLFYLIPALFACMIACKGDEDKAPPTPAEMYAGCCGTAPAQITIGTGKVFVPSAFTPNADGINDRFLPLTNGDISLIQEFRIMDRDKNNIIGLLNFMPNDPLISWDGYQSNGIQYEGLFHYRIVAVGPSGATQTVEGSACCIVCPADGTLLPIENGAACGFPTQTSGNGVFDPTLPDFETKCY